MTNLKLHKINQGGNLLSTTIMQKCLWYHLCKNANINSHQDTINLLPGEISSVNTSSHQSPHCGIVNRFISIVNTLF